jgi:multisubunit Na+/H+ antiporter MnhB subunit
MAGTEAGEAPGKAIRMLAAIGTFGLALLLGLALMAIPETGGLAEQVERVLPRAGVAQPVTAVLLNVRAWDTWLELVVLLLALAGTLGLGRRLGIDRPPPVGPGPALDWTARVLAPIGVLTGGLLLWLGTHSAGGAFQAGAVLGATAILAWLAGRASLTILPARVLRLVASAGVLVFAGVAVLALAAGHPALHLDPSLAGTVIVVLEIAATASVAITLAALFLAAGMGAR